MRVIPGLFEVLRRHPEGALFACVLGTAAYLSLAMPVFSQEAYYWTYAQHPDLSYYDHPPMVAWLILLGTTLFGDGAAGIRFGTWLCSAIVAWLGLALLRDMGITKRGRSAWLVLLLCVPILGMTHFLANPDAPLVTAWIATLLCLWRARDGVLHWWLLAGAAAGCALLSKYTAAFLLPGGILVMLMDPRMRPQWRRPGPWLAVLVSAAVFSPVVIWNVLHDFESFRFQTAGRLERATPGLRWFGEFVGGQFLVFNPVVAVAMACSIAFLSRRVRRDPRALWLLAFALPMAGTFLVASVFMHVKVNWLAPVAATAALGTAVWWDEAIGRVPSRSWRVATWAAVSVTALLLFAPLIRLFPQRKGATWFGWDRVAAAAEAWEERVDTEDGVEGNMFFFAMDYKDAAQLTRSLSLHAKRSPVPDLLETTMAQNVLGRSALQFGLWENPRSRIGENAILVLPRPEDRAEILAEARSRFDAVERVERIDVACLGIDVLTVDLFVCRGYRGPAATEVGG